MAEPDDKAFLKKYGTYKPQTTSVPVATIRPVISFESEEESTARRAGEQRQSNEEIRQQNAARLAQEAAGRAEQASEISKASEGRAISADERARVKELRDAFRGEDAIKDYEKAFPNYVAALKTEPSEDLTLLYLYAKTIDPQSTVGASDMDNINSSDARLPGAVQSALRELRASDGKFTDAARSSIRSGLHKVITQKNQAYGFTRDRFMSDAQSDVYNVDPMLVVGKPFGTQRQVDDIKSYWRKEYERNPESIPEAFRNQEDEAPAVEPELVEFDPNPNLVVGKDGKVYDKRTGQVVDPNQMGFFESAAGTDLGQALYAGVGDIAQGVGEMAGIVGNPANAAVNALFGTELSTDLGQTFREATGAPQGDPLASAINRAGVTGLTGIGGASLAARTLPTLASREIAATLATQPAQQVAANIGGGAAAEVVRQQGGGIPAQLAATIAGGIPAAGAVNLGQSMMRAAPDVISSFRGAPQAVSSGMATEVADVAPTSLIAQVTDVGMGQKRYSTPEGAFVTVMENAPYAPRQNSVTGFFVPEDARGQRIGSQLLEEVLRKYPAEDISTSISSEPSARAFYNLGFRPLGNPTGSLDDALAIMREDSSVSMAIPKGGDSPLKIDPATQVSPRMFEAGETVTSRSGGAMGTSPEQIRLMQAEGLPVPVQLTRGAAARDPEQLAFEKEQIYTELGGPLRRRAEENNLQALQNFDRFIDMTGAEAPDVASTGNAVINALSNGYQASKNRVRTAYTAADKSGETAEMVPYNSLIDFINQQTPTTRTTLAPILQSTVEKLNMEDPAKTGMVSIRSLEDVRKSINRAVQPNTPNEAYGKTLKDLIDTATEGVGGDLYKKARQLRIDQANKFENRAIVARLVSNIKNMDDRKVPADRVFKTAILNDSPENIQFLRRTLRDLGDDGKQAWSDIQGATLRHIQKRATANVNKTSENLDVVSAAQLNKAVDELDQNGRLDLILNPKVAQQVRDLRDVVQYVNTVPPGTSINNSGTARTLVAALGEMAITGATTSIPLPILTGIKVIRDQVKNAKIKKQINRSLLPRDQRD
jgi:GNAT superfamily N-acetyltransferase